MLERENIGTRCFKLPHVPDEFQEFFDDISDLFVERI
jgi:hypothetical protein